MDARTRMILAAERLFAERGVGAVSLREVGAAAGQRNNSAVQYHFGTKDGLVEAVFVHRMTPIEAERRRRLHELDLARRPPTDRGSRDELRDLMVVFIAPLADALVTTDGHRSHYARFLDQIMTSDESRLLPYEHPVMATVVETFRRAERGLTGIPVALRVPRLQAAAGYAIRSLADRERAAPAAAGARLPDAVFLDHLIDTTVGLLTAPVSPDTQRALRATRAHRKDA